MNESRFFFTDMTSRELNRSLLRAWNDYIGKGELAGSLRPVIADSWNRCKQRGVNPAMNFATSILQGADFERKLQEEEWFINVVYPYVISLDELLNNTGYMVTLCDANGVILKVSGDSKLLCLGEQYNFCPGADWSEESAGTNAMGTALKEGSPIQVFAAEHFCQGWHHWTCSAAPIKHPVNGQIIGLINLTGNWKTMHPHSLGLVTSIVKAIEYQLQQKQMTDDLLIIDVFKDAVAKYPNDGILAMDGQGRIIRANTCGGEILGININQLIGRLIRHKPQSSKYLLSNSKGEEIPLPIKAANIEEQNILGSNGQAVGSLVFLRTLRRNPLLRDNSYARTFKEIIGNSPALKRAIELAWQVATTDLNVLITGETGTGKEVFARAIHSHSSRKSGPFIAINCGAIPKDLIASELFGYAGGAFTGANKHGNPGKFELASGGTIFLDEIGEMPYDLQVSLLRVLEQKEFTRIGDNKSTPVDVRIIAATNRDLERALAERKFREDLFYRLNVVNTTLPPLRERGEDILLLARHFIRQSSPCLQGVDAEVEKVFMSYHWPGNVRELQNVIQSASLLARDSIIHVADLPSRLQQLREKVANNGTPDISDWERKAIISTIQQYNGNLSMTARKLKISRATLYRKMALYGIRVERHVDQH